MCFFPHDDFSLVLSTKFFRISAVFLLFSGLKSCFFFCNYHAKIFKSFYNISTCFGSSFKSKAVKIRQNFAWFIRIKAQNRAEKTSNSLHFFTKTRDKFLHFDFKKSPHTLHFLQSKKPILGDFSPNISLFFQSILR